MPCFYLSNDFLRCQLCYLLLPVVPGHRWCPVVTCAFSLPVLRCVLPVIALFLAVLPRPYCVAPTLPVLRCVLPVIALFLAVLPRPDCVAPTLPVLPCPYLYILIHLSFYLFIYLRVCLDCKLGASVQNCVCLSVCQECLGADGYVSACVNCTTCS